MNILEGLLQLIVGFFVTLLNLIKAFIDALIGLLGGFLGLLGL